MYSRRQEEGETLEQFHGVLQALAAKCKLRDMEEETVRDMFLTNMNDLELQKKFFVGDEMNAETVLQTALTWESGLENQKSIAKLVKSKPNSAEISSPKSANADLRVMLEDNTPTVKMEPIGAVQRPMTGHTVGRRQHIPDCRTCGNGFTQGHKARCPAKGQTCRNCGKRDHFARVCRSSQEGQHQQQQRRGYNANRGEHAPTNPKRMRYIEQQDDIESLLEAGEQTQVREISTDMSVDTDAKSNEHQEMEGDLEINLKLDEWDDYSILAVTKQKTHRFTVDINVGEE